MSAPNGTRWTWLVAVVILVIVPVGLVVTLVGVLVVGSVLLAASASAGGPSCTTPVDLAPGTAQRMLDGLSSNDDVRAQQWANAAAIVSQGSTDGVPVRGLVIAVMTARQESSLVNVDHGDLAGPDSRGLFQQRDPWGPLAVRMSPRGAAHLFFTGGHGGDEPGLLDVAGWQTMPLWQAAYTVQRSAARYARAYDRWQSLATTMVAVLVAGDGGDPAAVLAGSGCSVSAGPAGWTVPMPAGRYTLTSPFGMRTLFGEERLHAGQDLAAPVGTPVYAASAGVVTFTGLASGYGNLVEVKHPSGVVTRYAHLSVIRARPGPIDAGAVLGLSGGAPGAPGSGRSTGPHLHFEVRRNGTPIDPAPWMRDHGAPL